MIAIYPVAILFFASGLQSARSEPPAPVLSRWRSLTARASFGAVAAIALLLVCLVTPYAMHSFSRPSDYISLDYASSQRRERGETTMFMAGASSMAGLLVVADDVPLPTQVPSMHVSDFVKIVRVSGIENYQSLVTPPSDAPCRVAQG